MAHRSEAPRDGELDFGAVGRALWRKKLWILMPAVIVAAVSFVAVNMLTPRYKSEARILIEGRENVFMRPEAEKSGDRDRSAIDQEAVTSQVQLVLSRDLARQVIKQLKLNELPEFDSLLNGIGPVRQALMMLGVAKDPLRMSPEERVLEAYYDRIQAFQVEKSRVIAIEFQSADPELAGKTANTIAEVYLGLQQTVKQDQTKAASHWLAAEIENLRPKVAEAESKADDFRSKANLFVGSNNSTLSTQQLGELSSQLAVARSQQAESDAKARLIREMLQSNRQIESSDIVNSELIRRLNEQRVTLKAQLAEQSSTLMDAHPRIKELKAQIGDLERQIRGEAERLVRSLENDAKIAGARVEQLGSGLDQLKRLAASSSGQDVQLRALEREAKAQRDLLESYLAKYREATARENLGASPAEARIISRPIVSNTPYFPKKLPIVLVATLATLMLTAGFITTGELVGGGSKRGVGVAYTVVPTPNDAARMQLQHAIAGEMPQNAVVIDDDRSVSAVADKLRTIAGGGARTLVVGLDRSTDTTSAAIGLARELASQASVVVIELGLTAPKLAGYSSDPAAPGIIDLIRGSMPFGQIIARDSMSRVHLIAAGRVDAEAAAVLESDRLGIALDALSRTYQHVIIDVGTIYDIPTARLTQLGTCAVLVAVVGAEVSVNRACESLRAAGFVEPIVMSAPSHRDVLSSPAAAA